MNTYLSIFLVSSLLYLTEAGDFKVRSHPKYLTLTPNDNTPFPVSTLTNNLLVLLGLSPEQNTELDRPLFYSENPWRSPKSIWLLHVEGVDRLWKTGYLLNQDETFDINTIQSKLQTISDNHGVAIESIHIKPEFDLKTLEETLKSKVSALDKDARVKYVGIVCDICENAEPVTQIRKALAHVGKTIVSENPETLMITMSTKEKIHVRRSRQAANQAANVTIAEMYSDEYATMFNLFFWTSLVLVIVVIAIVYVFLTLDPGSDTIIYRMTTPRLKVD